MESGLEAMGQPVPDHRVEVGYQYVKSLGLDSLTAMSITKSASRAVKNDDCIRIIGENSHLSEDMAKIDLCARYILLSVLCTAEASE